MSEETASSVEEQDTDGADELAPGTELLQGQYKITAFLNAGGFGITYRAQDSLERPIVIKECFPGAFCRRSRSIVQARSRAHKTEFASIVRHFVEEAKSLSKLDHKNIVGVHQVWEENDTAYMALDFVEGRDLLDIIEDEDLVSTLQPPQIENILRQVLDAIGFVHSQDMLHRDISPDNILVRPDLTPVLIDFGAARQQVNTENKVLSALRVVKDGYSPQEFYVTGSDQGPYSDLYALGASFYHVITGEAPPDSQTRLSAIATGTGDPYQPLDGRIEGYPHGVLASIDASLRVLPAERLQTASDWLAMMDVAAAPASAVAPSAPQAAANTPAEPKGKAGLMIGVAAAALIAAGVGAYSTGMFDQGPVADNLVSAVDTSAPAASTETPPSPEQVTEVVTPVPTPAEPEAPAVDVAEQATPDIDASSEDAAQVDVASAQIAAPEQAAEASVSEPGLEETPEEVTAEVVSTPTLPEVAEEVFEEDFAFVPDTPRFDGAPLTSAFPKSRPSLEAKAPEAEEAPETGIQAASLIEEDLSEPTESTTTTAEIAAIVLPATPSPSPETASQAIEGRLIDLNSQDMAAISVLPDAPAGPGSLAAGSAAVDRLVNIPALPETPEVTVNAQTAELSDHRRLSLPGNLSADAGAADAQATEAVLGALASGEVTSVNEMPKARAVRDAQIAVAALAGNLAELPETPVAAASAQAASFDDFQPLFLPAGLSARDANAASQLSEAVVDTSTGWPVAIALQAPEFGAEIVPVSAPAAPTSLQPELATEGNFVQTDWAVALPFRDLRADALGNLWIRQIEGLDVDRREDLNRVIKEMYDLSGVDEVSLNLGLGLRDGPPMLDQALTLAVVQETSLPNGLQFEARAENGQWVTRVVRVPSGVNTDLAEGDVIFAYVPTGERIEGRTSLPELLSRELLSGQPNFSFAVQRDGNVWLASLTP